MPNRSADTLFQLIHTLEKSEKRSFKLYIKRNSANEDLKIIRLFDALEKMTEYDEAVLLKKVPSIPKRQLANSKAHLYREILSSLRLLTTENHISIQLNAQLDYARILYNKGLYHQSLKILERIKEVARTYNQYSLLVHVLSTEKKIETLHITRSMQDRAQQLALESEEIIGKVKMIAELSSLALELYSWYIKNGHARNEEDEKGVRKFFKEKLPELANEQTGFYERLYLYQCYCWYAFIRQDFLMYYRYTKKWVDIFKEEPLMLGPEPAQYIKGLHNLLNAHFDLRNFEAFRITLKEFEDFAATSFASKDFNNQVLIFVYLTTARFNQHFMEGTFKEGLSLVPFIEEKLDEYTVFLDRHRILVFYYKIATVYFGSGDYSTCIDYLQKIINWNVDLRNDLQCYARLLHLIAHYELGNYDIIEHLIKSVYRFMAKMGNLTVVEEEIFRFLKATANISPRKMQPEFEKLLIKIKKFEKSRFETRAFAYLDIISWLESKVYNKPISVIVNEKFKAHKERRY